MSPESASGLKFDIKKERGDRSESVDLCRLHRLCVMLAVQPSDSRVVAEEPGRVLHGVKETISLVQL